MERVMARTPCPGCRAACSPKRARLRRALAKRCAAPGTRARSASHRHLGLDVRMRVVTIEREVFVTEGEDVLHVWIDTHRRQRARAARQLQMRLLDVIEIEMRVAAGPDEVARL